MSPSHYHWHRGFWNIGVQCHWSLQVQAGPSPLVEYFSAFIQVAAASYYKTTDTKNKVEFCFNKVLRELNKIDDEKFTHTSQAVHLVQAQDMAQKVSSCRAQLLQRLRGLKGGGGLGRGQGWWFCWRWQCHDLVWRLGWINPAKHEKKSQGLQIEQRVGCCRQAGRKCSSAGPAGLNMLCRS